VVVSAVRADLGQTRSEIENHWGKPIPCPVGNSEPGTEKLCYHRPSHPCDIIEVTYLEGISQRERYGRYTSARLDREDDSAVLSEKDFNAILTANAAGRRWNAVSIAGVPYWFLDGHDMSAPAVAIARTDRGGRQFPVNVQTYAMGVKMAII